MSDNPNVQASFSGTIPNVNVSVSSRTRNVGVDGGRGGDVYGVYIDTTANWNEKLTYIPKKGERIIYSDKGQITVDDTTVNVPGVKIGDGLAYLIDLPWVGADMQASVLAELGTHTGNNDIHVTAEKKTFWDNKLNCQVSDKNLILNRL